MCGRCACGLFGDRQSKTFSEILEENKSRNPTGVCQSCGTSFSKVADCSAACMNADLPRRSQPVVFMTSADLLRNSTSFPKQEKEFWMQPISLCESVKLAAA